MRPPAAGQQRASRRSGSELNAGETDGWRGLGGGAARLMNANQLPVGWSIMDAGHVDPGRTRRRFQGRITEEVLSGPLKRAQG